MIATFVLAYIFWRAGAWAGGDVKLFTALAALNPLNEFFLGNYFGLSFVWDNVNLLAPSHFPFFMLNLFILSVFMLIPYTGLLALQALHHQAKREQFVHVTLRAFISSIQYTLLIVLFQRALEWAQLSLILIPILLILVSFIPNSIRWLLALLAFAGIVNVTLSVSHAFELFILIAAVDLVITWYGFARQHVLTLHTKISELKEGDISNELIVMENGEFKRILSVSLKMIIKSAKARDVMQLLQMGQSRGEKIANPASAAGFYPEQIKILQQAVRDGKLSDSIQLKASAPMVPAVLMAYLALQLLGDGPLQWVFK